MSEINLNEEVEMVVEDASVITTPIDDTLTQSGEAADAKAVGDALATKADISQVTGITVNGQSPDAQGAILIDGDEIPVSGTDSTLLVEALAALDAKTGEDIPIDSESGADSIADAIGSIQTALATGVVATSEQTLETEQKAQARENIAAASQADVNTINTVTTYALNNSTATAKVTDRGSRILKLGKLVIVGISCDVAESVDTSSDLYNIPSTYTPSSTVYAISQSGVNGSNAPVTRASSFIITNAGKVRQNWTNGYSGWFTALFVYTV